MSESMYFQLVQLHNIFNRNMPIAKNKNTSFFFPFSFSILRIISLFYYSLPFPRTKLNKKKKKTF